MKRLEEQFEEWVMSGRAGKQLKPNSTSRDTAILFAKEAVNSALQEAAEKCNEKIRDFEEDKIKSRKEEDQYSWNISDDYQNIWKEAKESIVSLQIKYTKQK